MISLKYGTMTGKFVEVDITNPQSILDNLYGYALDVFFENLNEHKDFERALSGFAAYSANGWGWAFPKKEVSENKEEIIKAFQEAYKVYQRNPHQYA